MNCSSLLGMGDADSRQNVAPRIQLICPLTARPIAHERDALSLGLLERHVVIARLTAVQGPAASAGGDVLERIRGS